MYELVKLQPLKSHKFKLLEDFTYKDVVVPKDYDNLTVVRNGNNIMDADEDLTVDSKNANFTLIFYNNDWRINE